MPKFLRRYGYTDELFFNKYANKNDEIIITGSKTEFVCDTANVYHCGSFCKSKSRLVLAFRYTSSYPLYSHSNWAQVYNLKYNQGKIETDFENEIIKSAFVSGVGNMGLRHVIGLIQAGFL